MSKDRGDELELEEELEEEELEEEEDELEDEDEDVEEEETSEDEDENEDEEEEGEEEEPQIPKSRLDEVIAQREEERKRVETLQDTVNQLLQKLDLVLSPKEEEALEEEVNYNFDLAEKKYAELILNEDFETAAALRKEIDENRTVLIQRQIEEAQKKSLKENKELIEQEKFETLRISFEKQYDIFNPDKDGFNEDAVEMVNTLMAGFMAKGATKSAALNKAVEKVVKIYDTPKPKQVQKDRTNLAKKKALKTMKSQPAKTKGEKVLNKELDISKIPDKEFKKLSSREKAILRGDIIE